MRVSLPFSDPPRHEERDAFLDLSQRLRQQYPATWPERLKSYENGTNTDLKAWRALGKAEGCVSDSARLLWWQGYSVREVSERTGLSEGALRRTASRHNWTRSEEGHQRLASVSHVRTCEAAEASNARRHGWPAPKGDTVFVGSLVREALRLGLVRTNLRTV